MRLGSRILAAVMVPTGTPRAAASPAARSEAIGSTGVSGTSGIQRPVPLVSPRSRRATYSVPFSSSREVERLSGSWTFPSLTYFQMWPPRRSSPM